MRRLLFFALLLLIPSLGWSSDVICGNGPRRQCADTIGATNYHPSVDFAEIADPTCVEIPPEPPSITEGQRVLIETVKASHRWGRCHLTIVSGLMAEMTQPEKDVVNAAMQAVEDAEQAKHDEVTQNDFCNSTDWTEIATKIENMRTNIQGDITSLDGLEPLITGIASMADAKTIMIQMNNAYQSVLTSMHTKYMNGFEKIARCEFAKRP